MNTNKENKITNTRDRRVHIESETEIKPEKERKIGLMYQTKNLFHFSANEKQYEGKK